MGEDSEGLYLRTGFQQLVQGKRGENWGENRVLFNIFVLCHLERLDLGVVVLGDWFTRQNVSSVPSLLGLGTCQIGQVRGIASDLWDSVQHLSRWWRKT